MVERIIVVVLTSSTDFPAIAFVLAAKDVARFPELKEKEFAERYLVGTLASIVLAMIFPLLLHLLWVMSRKLV